MHNGSPWMRRALQLARLGAGGVAPNPLVGAVLVRGDRVLAEGWHRRVGSAHAEVECLRAYGDAPLPDDAVLYVTLEPCSHHGRTPPCADLLIERGVRQVVVAHVDPFPEVAGRGIERLREAGVRVHVGDAGPEARWTNRRFLTSVQHARPYIILKWARSSDGFLDRHPRGERGVQRIGHADTDVLVHRWRSEEQAIMVGSRTVVNDDPELTVRHVQGRSPLRVVVDRAGRTPGTSKVYDGSVPSLVFTHEQRSLPGVEQHLLHPDSDALVSILGELHRRGIRSVLVEGGATLLDRFLERGLWDEARVIHGAPLFLKGTAAPVLGMAPQRSFTSGTDIVHLYLNTGSPAHGGHNVQTEWPW